MKKTIYMCLILTHLLMIIGQAFPQQTKQGISISRIEKDSITIQQGKYDGIKKDEIYNIVRNSEIIGKAKVVIVLDKLSGLKIIEMNSNYQVKKNDILILSNLLKEEEILLRQLQFNKDKQTYLYNLKMHIGYPIPSSKIAFKNMWVGRISIDGSYNSFLDNNFFTGLIFNYSGFQIDKSELNLNTKGNCYNLYFLLGYSFNKTKSTNLNLIAGIGYTWINYENIDFNYSMNENGVSFLPRVDFEYLLTKNIGFDISLSYPITFEEFGEDPENSADTTEEESTIRWWDIGMGFVFYF